jgi:hypothetical protein
MFASIKERSLSGSSTITSRSMSRSGSRSRRK